MNKVWILNGFDSTFKGPILDADEYIKVVPASELEAARKERTEFAQSVIRRTLEVDKLIESLTNERDQALALLSEAVDVLRYYANKDHWHHGIAYSQNALICDTDLYCNKGDRMFGGKRANKIIDKIQASGVLGGSL